MRIIKKILAVMLVIMMVATTQQGIFIVLADEISKTVDTLDKIDLPSYIPDEAEDRSKHIKRLKEDENEYMAIFENEDGTISVYSFSEPIQYRDSENNLIDYDSKLKEVKDKDKKNSGYSYEISSSDVSIMLPADIATNKYVSLEKDKYKIDFKPITDLSKNKNKYEIEEKHKVKQIKDDGSIYGVEYLSADSDKIKYKYYTQFTGIKEDIVFEEAPQTNILQFELKIKGIIPVLYDTGEMIFLDEETQEQIGGMSPFFMYDSYVPDGIEGDYEAHLSENIKTELEQDKNNKNKYILTVYLDEEMLYDENTVYPVIVDPSINLNTTSELADSYVCSNRDANYSSSYALFTGKCSTGRYRSYVKPVFPSSYNAYSITSAYYKAYHAEYLYSSAAYTDIYPVTSSWSSNTIRWSNRASYDSTDRITSQLVNSTSARWYSWNIKRLVQDWVDYELSWGTEGRNPNYGFIIRDRAEDTKFRQFCSVNNGYYPSYLYITYSQDDYAPNDVVLGSQPNPVAVPGALNSGEGSVTLYWNQATDNGTSGVKEYRLKIFAGTVGSGTQIGEEVIINDDGSPTYSYTFEDLDDNTSYYISIKAKDNAGNVSGTVYSSSVTLPDRTGPTSPTLFTIDAIDWTNDITPSITWSGITDESVNNVDIEYTLDSGTTWIPTQWDGLSGAEAFDASVFTSDGEYSIQIRGVDTEENVGDASSSVVYKRDATLPTGEITSPISSQIESSVEIKGNISDATSGISNWYLEYGRGISPASWTAIIGETITYPAENVTLANWDTTGLDLGDYTIRLTAIDNAGNETIDTVTVTKHTVATSVLPTLTINSPIDESDFTDSTQTEIPVTYTWANGDSSTLTGKVYVDGEKQNEETTAGSGLTIDVSTYEEGSSHDIFVIAEGATNTECTETTYETSFTDEFGLAPIATLSDTEHNLGNVILSSVGSVYSASGEIVSAFTENIIPGYVYTAELTANEIKPTGTDIAYFISFDNAVTWQPISPNMQIEMETAVDPYVQIKAVLSTTDDSLTPVLEDWSITVKSVSGANLNTFTVNLVGVPTNVSATPDANYMTLVDWDDYNNGSGTLYNVYRGTSSDFIPSEINLVAEDVDQTFWYDYNLNYSTTFYYKVTALTLVNLIERESVPSLPTGAATVVSENELDKMLGLQDYWKYSNFRTGSGNGYINVASGNLVYTSVDSVYPGMLLAMIMRRTYNSQATTKTTMGYGWDFSYNTCLLREYDEYGAETGMILKDGDGTLHYFEYDSVSDTYSAPSGVFMTLTYDDTNEEYKIVRKDNISYTFDKNMKLIRMAEFDRNYISFEYYESGRLYQVIDNIGDTVTFEYYQNSDNTNLKTYTTDVEKIGLVAYMEDPAGREFYYSYQTSTGYLSSATFDIPNTTTDYTESYTYHNGTYDISSVFDGENKQTQINYNSGKVSQVIFPGSTEYYSLSYNNNVSKTLFDTTIEVLNTTTLTDNWNHSTEYAYDESGCVRIVTNPLGDSTEYTYNDNLQVTKLEYENIVYDSISQTSSLELIKNEFEYTSNGNIYKVKDAVGNITWFNYYNDFNQACEVKAPIEEENGVTQYATTYYDYDDGETGEGNTGNLLQTTDAEGNTTTNTYYSNGNLASTVSNLGSKTEYYYNANGWLTEIKQGSSSASTLTTISKVLKYDSKGKPTITVDGEGNASKEEYDALGRPVKSYLPDANTNYLISQGGNPEECQWTDNQYTVTTYDMNHNITSLRGTITPSGDQGLLTTYVYDDRDRMTSTTQDPYGFNVSNFVDYNTYSYNGKTCRKVISTDAEGVQSIAYYDEMGRIIKSSIYNGSTEIVTAEYEYDKVGNMTYAVDGDGLEAEAYYDKLNRQAKTVTDPTGDAISSSNWYDFVGNVVKTVNGEGYVTLYDFDKLGRILSVTQGETPEDANPSDDAVTSYEYDLSSGYSQAEIKNTMTDAEGHIKETHLDAFGRAVVEVNIGDDNNSTNMTVLRTYNNSGQVLTSTYAAGTTEEQTDYYTYDEWGQLKRIGYGSETSTDNETTYIYDAQGRMTDMTDRRADVDNSATINEVSSYWAYNTLGRVTSTTQDSNTISYIYNDNGKVTEITYLDDIDFPDIETTTLKYVYDGYGRLDLVQQKTDIETAFRTVRDYEYTSGGSKVDYFIDNLEFDQTSGTNQMRTNYEYNNLGQVSLIEYYDNTDLTSAMETYGYTYDDRGYIETEDIDSIYTQNNTDVTVDVYKSYEYDYAGRLETSNVTVDGSSTTNSTSWTYDNVGNRLTQDNGTEFLEYDYNEFNQLEGIDKTVDSITTDYKDYTYDERGAQVTETKVESGTTTTTLYTYDAAGRMAKTSDGTNTTKNFYNGSGQRIRQLVESDITKYYYTGSALLFTTDGNNVKLTENILTPGGSIIASERFTTNAGLVYSSGFNFYNYDLRQSTTVILDDSFELMQGYTYDEFGNTDITTANSFLNDVTFTGAISDTTGLQYMNARFYDSDTGRFLTQDTYTGNAYEPWSQHLYSYCGNNPVNMIDPTGHSATLLGAAAGFLIGGLIGGGAQLVTNMINKEEDVWSGVGSAALKGAVGGAIVGACAGMVIDSGGTAAIGFAICGTSSIGTAAASTTAVGGIATAAWMYCSGYMGGAAGEMAAQANDAYKNGQETVDFDFEKIDQSGKILGATTAMTYGMTGISGPVPYKFDKGLQFLYNEGIIGLAEFKKLMMANSLGFSAEIGLNTLIDSIARSTFDAVLEQTLTKTDEVLDSGKQKNTENSADSFDKDPHIRPPITTSGGGGVMTTVAYAY